ncbi:MULTISPECIES: OsmC family protein [unclassified Microbacterium]|uniref:OsmC family protein n=1 Tax=unclassified Microbacterium TaxID=2609290 RepID=UPI00097F2242|nr:OsmC family protein [Microbacterium sp. JB110]RCS57758.1 OsmC family peroxiredoxin [Microbacterium sp. JB110]SJM67865.1 OsmC/Ohr family protein [Frigoribacterium sp. JB110]
MIQRHSYALTATWTGNRGSGTSGTRDYDRSVTLRVDGKPDLLGSADKPFFGDPERWNPEDLLIAALAQCHLLSYLRACVLRGVVVTGYTDSATGEIELSGDGGRFIGVTLRPSVTVADAGMREAAAEAHADAHAWCFIANSVSFPVGYEPIVEVAA